MNNESKANRLEIAKRIKNARKNAGLTQAFVASQLNLTPQAISNYERGKNNIPAPLLFELANLYGLQEFSFLDSLPESYNLSKATVGSLQYEALEYDVELNNELARTSEFERRNVIQKKIRELSPNEVEVFLAEKMQYGSVPDYPNVPVTADEISSVCAILDSLLYAAIQEKDFRYQNAYRRLSQTISLLQAANKVKTGYDFTHEELPGAIPPGTDLSECIKKYDPNNPPEDAYIMFGQSDDGKPVLILHEAPTSEHCGEE